MLGAGALWGAWQRVRAPWLARASNSGRWREGPITSCSLCTWAWQRGSVACSRAPIGTSALERVQSACAGASTGVGAPACSPLPLPCRPHR